MDCCNLEVNREVVLVFWWVWPLLAGRGNVLKCPRVLQSNCKFLFKILCRIKHAIRKRHEYIYGGTLILQKKKKKPLPSQSIKCAWFLPETLNHLYVFVRHGNFGSFFFVLFFSLQVDSSSNFIQISLGTSPYGKRTFSI